MDKTPAQFPVPAFSCYFDVVQGGTAPIPWGGHRSLRKYDWVKPSKAGSSFSASI